MTEEQRELARRLVAAEWWDWADLGGDCPLYMAGQHQSERLPNLARDATGGVLLGVLATRGLVEVIGPDDVDPMWDVRLRHGGDGKYHRGTTLAEACARALLELRS